jgi:hypothetical protein
MRQLENKIRDLFKLDKFETNKPVAIKVKNGLCNRLRTLGSFHALAKELNRPFLLCWDRSNGWSDERFEDLFENPIMQITTAQFLELASKSLCIEKYFHNDQKISEPGFDIDMLNDRSRAITYFGDRELVALFPRKVTLWRWPTLGHGYRTFVRSLRPIKSCLHEIDRVSAGFDRSIIGVHIRRGDALQSTIAEKFLVSSDEAFLNEMSAIVRQNDKATFFLATDCDTTQATFQKHFGSRISVNDKKRFVANNWLERKENQADAVIDLWLLSRTSRIIGNNYSSFSSTAALIGDIPLSIAKSRP